MSTREEFMRQMGLTADDIEDPDSYTAKKSKFTTRNTTTTSSSSTATRRPSSSDYTSAATGNPSSRANAYYDEINRASKGERPKATVDIQPIYREPAPKAESASEPTPSYTPAQGDDTEDDTASYLAARRRANERLAAANAASVAEASRMFTRMGEEEPKEEVHDSLTANIPPRGGNTSEARAAFLRSMGIDNMDEPILSTSSDPMPELKISSRQGSRGVQFRVPTGGPAVEPPQRASQEYTTRAPRKGAAEIVIEEERLRSDGFRSMDRAACEAGANGGVAPASGSFCKSRLMYDDMGPSTESGAGAGRRERSGYKSSDYLSGSKCGLNGSLSGSYARTTNSLNDTVGSTTRYASTTASQENNMSVGELKDAGNRSFEDGDFRRAVRLYSKAIEKDPSNAALYSNRSAAYLQATKQMGIDTRTMALRDADKVIELRPTWFKGFSRKGDALFKLERFVEAVQAYERGLELDEGNVNLMHSLGEARNACGGRMPSKVAAWDTVQHTVNSPPRPKKDAFELMEELRSTINEVPTGNEYRRAELEKFRHQKPSGSVSRPSFENVKTEIPVAPLQRTIDRSSIPEELNVDAAYQYQNKLLEEYRQKKAAMQRR